MLPSSVRQELKFNQLKKNSRLVIVGDVHGCIDPVKELLQKVNFEHRRDYIVFTGDLVNKGPNSCEVIDFVQNLGAWSVRGNHDDHVLALYNKLNSPNGSGQLKLEESDEWIRALTKRQAKYLDSLPFILDIPCLKVIIVHAGLVPEVPVNDQKLEDLYRMRTVVKTEQGWLGKELWEEGVSWIKVWNGPEHVFFGHDALRRLQLTEFATGLDTGCVYGGKLTAAVIPIGELMKQKDTSSESNEFVPTRDNLNIQIVMVSNKTK
eukprot:g4945.t1